MTYARARLFLGMSGVGSIVVLSTYLLVSGLPLAWLPQTQTWSGGDVMSLLKLFVFLTAILAPLDLLGGFLLPNRWRPGTIGLAAFVANWLRGVLVQGGLFVVFGIGILVLGRSFGLAGAAAAVGLAAVGLIAFQARIARWVGALQVDAPETEVDAGSDQAKLDQAKLDQAIAIASQWGWTPKRIGLMRHHDTGFTGGIVGLPGWETVVVPTTSLRQLSAEQLAATIARRVAAIENGSRARGLVLSLLWVVTGFVLASLLPGAGVQSVAALAMTCLGFTLWTFLGLLTLPTLSRQASYAIDGAILESGVAPNTLQSALKTLDGLQDDEPKRSAVVETIFHPVPSVENRQGRTGGGFPIAWHALRMTLFVSWAAMGMLVRAVHCNVGRPELWVMLPTD